jgi:hypothetical protein
MCYVVNNDAIDIDQYLREELTPKKDEVYITVLENKLFKIFGAL